ncbi:MAG: outer membrane protein assembly factor BamA, partial [Proteobacteria bacterium]|nr:outer membrane protein assembly factor BamA [Pseudomonadota bacterium]
MRKILLFVVLHSVLSVTVQAQGLTPPGILGGEGSDIGSEIAELGEEEFVGQKVVEIHIEGNKRVSADDISVNLGTRRGMEHDPTRVARDVRSLYDLGFFSDIQVTIAKVEGGVALTYTVEEKPAVNEVTLEGNDEVDEEDINEVIDIKPNEPLDVPTIHRNVQKIRDLYSEEGFFLAQITYRLEESGANAYNVVIVIDENAQVQVRRFTFVGNHALTDAQIAQYLATRTAGPLSILTDSGKFNRELFDRDLTLISAIYWDKGYLDVKIGTPRVELTPDRRYIFLSIPIEEGPRYQVGRVTVMEHDAQGNEIDLLGGRRIVRSMVLTERDTWFSRTSVVEDLNRITRYYQDRGYAHVNVDLKTLTRPGERIVDLVLDINRGPMVYFERVEIRGNTKTRDRVIRREVVIHEGEEYSQTGLDVSKARVTQLGYFEVVDVTTSPGSAKDKMIVTVEVAEKQTGQFQVGIGFSSVEKFIAQAQVSEQNFLGQGQTVSLQMQLSGLRRIFMFNFWEPYFLDTQWTLAFRMFNTLMAQIDFDRTATGGELTLGHSLGLRDLKLYLTYNAQYVQVNTGQSSAFLLGGGRRPDSGFYQVPLAHLFEEGWNCSIKAMLAYDKRNNRLFPTAGSYNSISVEWATKYLGSDFNFLRYSLTTRWYFPLFWKFVLRINGTFGLIYSLDNQGVAIVHRYRSGGIMDVRGFFPWSLGPRISIPSVFDPNAPPTRRGINIGGNMKITLNTEIEFPIIEMVGIKGVVFFDAGNSFNLEDTWCQAGGGRGINKYTDPCL